MAYASFEASRVSESLSSATSDGSDTLFVEALECFCQIRLPLGLRRGFRTGLGHLVGVFGHAHAGRFGFLGERARSFDGALNPLLGHHLPFFGALRTGTPRARSSALSLALPCLMPAFLSAARSAASVHFFLAWAIGLALLDRGVGPLDRVGLAGGLGVILRRARCHPARIMAAADAARLAALVGGMLIARGWFPATRARIAAEFVGHARSPSLLRLVWVCESPRWAYSW